MPSQYILVTPGSEVFKPYDKKRDCYEQLTNFMKLPTRGKICALYGLRRTGKTVMMEQCIAELPEEEKQKSAYLLCLNGCDMLEVRRVMEPLYEKGTRNFFIDEITAVTDFQKYGNVLSDYFSAKGAKVIIAGTDSLGIMLAESDILYDRIQMIHTSHVPYAEFSELLGGKSLDDYIEYGGTLTKEPYKTLQSSSEYLNTAIVGNILHSLEKSEDARRYGAALTELYDHDELQSVLNKMINKFSYFVTVQAVNKYFKSAPLYSTIHNIREPSYISKINVEEANQRTKDILGIKNQDEMDTSLSKQHIAEVTSSPAYRGGGFLSQKANRRFSFDDTTVSSISELSPCAPRFFLYSCHCRLYIRRIPSFRILTAALTSLSWCVPHFGQIHARIRRSFVSVFLYPHTLHSWLLAKKRPTFTSCFPCSSILYFRKFTNIPQPLSKTDLPKCSACDIAFISRSSIQTQSYASAIFRDCLCKKSLRWAATFSCILATRIRCFPRFLEPFCIFESFRCSLFNFCSAFL